MLEKTQASVLQQGLRLSKGETATFEISFDVAAVHEHCRRVGDTNPQHESYESALAWAELFRQERPPHGQIAVPGCKIIEVYPPKMIEWYGPGTTFFELREFRFRRPVYTGEAAQVSITCDEYTGWGSVNKGLFSTVWMVGDRKVCSAKFGLAIP